MRQSLRCHLKTVSTPLDKTPLLPPLGVFRQWFSAFFFQNLTNVLCSQPPSFVEGIHQLMLFCSVLSGFCRFQTSCTWKRFLVTDVCCKIGHEILCFFTHSFILWFIPFFFHALEKLLFALKWIAVSNVRCQSLGSTDHHGNLE